MTPVICSFAPHHTFFPVKIFYIQTHCHSPILRHLLLVLSHQVLPHFSSFCSTNSQKSELYWCFQLVLPNLSWNHFKQAFAPTISPKLCLARSSTKAGDQFLAFILPDLSEALDTAELYFFGGFPGPHSLDLFSFSYIDGQ